MSVPGAPRPPILQRLVRLTRFSAAALLGALAAASTFAQGARPNVVLVVADDLGYADVGRYGAPSIATPNLDQLAAQGVSMRSFYVHPSCSPTRAALLTGKYAQRVGVPGPLGRWSATGLDPAEVTLAEELRTRGYRTGFFGKWHLGDAPEQLPLNQGFDEWFGSPWGLPGQPYVLFDSTGPTRWNTDPRDWTEDFTDRTIDFIDDALSASQPFFAVLAHHAPHFPATPGTAHVGRSADGREYGDAVEEIDDGVGRLVQHLAQRGIEQDTLVVFLSDNGPSNQVGPYQRGSAGPFTGYKGSTQEGGVRVPCILRWPAVLAADVWREEPVFVADLFPTLLGYLDGAPFPQGLVDGRDVWSVLVADAPPAQDAVFFTAGQANVEAVRRGPWKLRLGALYDVVVDPGETTDLALARPDIVQQLEPLRAALAIDLAVNRRPPAPSTRLRPTWRADLGLGQGTTLVDGATWAELEQQSLPFVVVDQDPLVDIQCVNAPPGRPIVAPGRTLRCASPSRDVRLVRTGAEFGGMAGGPMSLTLWLRRIPGVDAQLVVLDIGDTERGLSLTLGDFGVLGDDGLPGRFDDLRLRIGGSASPGSATLDVDLIGDGTTYQIIGLTADPVGRVTAYVDGFERAVVDAGAAIHWGGDEEWAIFSPDGELGGAGGAGVLPPAVSESAAELGGLRLWDRDLLRVEVEAEYARFNIFPYCSGGVNSTGKAAELDLFGSFLPDDRRLYARVTGLPAGGVGVLLAGLDQTRVPYMGGYLCVSGAVRRVRSAIPLGGGTEVIIATLAPPDVAPVGTPATTPSWLPTPGSSWQLQYVYRDGTQLQFSNAVSVILGL